MENKRRNYVIICLLTISTALFATDNIPVGSVKGDFSVTPLGSSSYAMSIDVPKGVNGLVPNIGIAYNSHSSNGICGWGVNLSGISMITRGPRDIFYDGQAQGLSYSKDDAFYLDGDRLILKESPANSDTAVYCLASNPYTRIVLHGLSGTLQTTMWFGVDTPDGMYYEYGRSDGKHIYTKNGTQKVNAWHVSKSEDRSGNYISYSYQQSDNYIYLSSVNYGGNSTAGSAHFNRISFTYETRTDSQLFYMDGCQGSMTWRLKKIQSYSTVNGTESLYRKYELAYNDSTAIDGSTTKFSRLLSVTESNAAGESLNPTLFEWNNLKAFSAQPAFPSLSLVVTSPQTQFGDICLTSADFNGDGVSDIVQHVYAYSTENGLTGYYNIYYIFLSSTQYDGTVTYSSPHKIAAPGDYVAQGLWRVNSNTPMTSDVDGDGKQDLVVPYLVQVLSNDARFYLLLGKDAGTASGLSHGKTYTLRHSTEMPCYSTADFDNDGLTDIVLMEKQIHSGSCDIHVFKGDTAVDSMEEIHFTLPMSYNPKKFFCADYNNDGLTDILVLNNYGHTIFWNNGGSLSASTFTSANKTTGTTLKNVSVVSSGDFNGDGLEDYITNVAGSTVWYFYMSKGDGTFNKVLACNFITSNQLDTDNDDDFFSCNILDLDGDGTSDMVFSKALFYGNDFGQTLTYWYLSNGSSFSLHSVASSTRQENSMSKFYMTGDFNGDGLYELGHFGYNCYNVVNANMGPFLYTFRNKNFLPGSGRLSSVTDGYGNGYTIEYKSMSDQGIYTRSGSGCYPLVISTLPISLTSKVTATNGVAGNNSTLYSYEDFVWHQQGRGALGFATLNNWNNTLGTSSEITVQQRNQQTLLPTVCYEQTSIGWNVSTVTKQYETGFLNGKKTAYHFLTLATEQDTDGNVTTTTCQNDIQNGVQLSSCKTGFDGAYVTTTNSSFVSRRNMYLPTVVTVLRHHPNSNQNITDVSHFAYDSKGRMTSQTLHYGTTQALTTAYTLDNYGNVTASSTTGSNIETVTEQNTFDSTHRFVTGNTERGYLVSLYTYDKWGNILTETDATRQSNQQMTTHTYDGWGRRSSTTHPAGQVTTYSTGWNTNGYYTSQHQVGTPGKSICYDSKGRIVYVSMFGPMGNAITKRVSYNSKGLPVSIVKSFADRQVTEQITYDNRRRITTHTGGGPAGTNLYYSYANHSVTTTKEGHARTQTYDSWGNVTTSSDAQTTITFSYGAHGKPLSITAAGSTISMEYDAVGNRTKLIDPDAGTSTYTYDALGRLKTQTDANGYQTINTYNTRGQLTQKKIGSAYTYYTYGTSNTNNGLLLSMSRDGETESYQYDSYGRLSQESRYFLDAERTLTKSYTYNQQGLLASKTYPNQLSVSYNYDSHGYLESMYSGSRLLYAIYDYTGLELEEDLGDSLSRSTIYDNQSGRIESAYMYSSYVTPHTIAQQEYTYNTTTGNLATRMFYNGNLEEFFYDAQNRLTRVKVGGTTTDNISYAANGNITARNNISYSYGSSRPHAVTTIEEAQNPLVFASSDFGLTFNELEKPTLIEDYEHWTGDSYYYGPDEERWEKYEGLYFGDYEEHTANNVRRSYVYLSGGVLYVSTVGSTSGNFYYMQTDNLGSIYHITDASGHTVFRASYDAWGQQTVSQNSIGFYRGYTGHEMLNDYGLINMNGRMYDPYTARFVSPDKYIQEPENSQNYNRYSYCLNNPMKYVDPTGNSIWSTLVAPFEFAYNVFEHGFNTSQYSWRTTLNAWKIDAAPFRGKALNVLSNLTWGFPNTMVGNTLAHFFNITGMANDVTHLDGLTAIGGVIPGGSAFTVGPYTFGPDNYTATWQDHLFVHEYGHYLQHLEWGPAYLPVIATASVMSNMGNNHDYHWYEADASARGARYFDRKYGKESSIYKMFFENNPIAETKAVKAMFFDKNAFENAGITPYLNPRTLSYNQKVFPTDVRNIRFGDIFWPMTFPVMMSSFSFLLGLP